MDFWYLTAGLGPILYWITVLLALLISLCCAVIAMRTGNRYVLAGAAFALGIGLVLVAFPVPSPSAVLSVPLTVAALALAVVGGGPAVLTVLSLATRGSTAAGTHGGIVVTADRTQSRTEVLRGGTTIGLVERFAVAGAIIAGFPSAIAVVVAVKSVGRFSELNAAESRERFIIGTLVSLAWACACAALVHFAVH